MVGRLGDLLLTIFVVHDVSLCPLQGQRREWFTQFHCNIWFGSLDNTIAPERYSTQSSSSRSSIVIVMLNTAPCCPIHKSLVIKLNVYHHLGTSLPFHHLRCSQCKHRCGRHYRWHSRCSDRTCHPESLDRSQRYTESYSIESRCRSHCPLCTDPIVDGIRWHRGRVPLQLSSLSLRRGRGPGR